MTDSLYDYAMTNNYILLALTANGMENYDSGFATIGHEDFDKDLLGVFEETDLSAPHLISMVDAAYTLNEHDEFHSDGKTASFSAGIIRLNWIKDFEGAEGWKTRAHRANEPATISFHDLVMFHDRDKLVKVSCSAWSARWYNDGRLTRDDGPYMVSGSATVLEFDSKGRIVVKKAPQLNLTWHTLNGENIPHSTAMSCLKEQDIKINLMARKGSVFDSPMEEVIFRESLLKVT